MRRLFLILVLLLLLPVRPAVAGSGGINLNWNDCGSFGNRMRNFACNTNSGQNVMVASFISPVPMDHFVGIAGVIDLCSMTTVTPPWWSMKNPGTCRPTALSASFDFTAGPSNCADYWVGGAAGGMDYTLNFPDPNSARIRVVAAIPSSGIQPVDDQTEYYAFKVAIQNQNTVGAGACAGCDVGVCIVFNSLQLAQQAGYGDHTLSYAIQNQYILWQQSVAGCPFIVPTRNRTWGQVKSLYK